MKKLPIISWPGILEQLNGMNEKLEEIQKSLDMYLETKRQIFPRFYFLSNDDLLEILGQSKNPEAIQVQEIEMTQQRFSLSFFL